MYIYVYFMVICFTCKWTNSYKKFKLFRQLWSHYWQAHKMLFGLIAKQSATVILSQLWVVQNISVTPLACVRKHGQLILRK